MTKIYFRYLPYKCSAKKALIHLPRLVCLYIFWQFVGMPKDLPKIPQAPA